MVARRPRFGVFYPQSPPYDSLRDRWRRAEELGFDSICVADHLTQFGPGISFEAWSLLGALARETSHVRIGALVTPIAFRHPVLLAMSAITVDHLSDGRLDVGIGAGGGDKDGGALGLPEWDGRERIERLEEQLAILDGLLRGESLSYQGRHYRSAASLARPVQQPRPPFVIAAQGPRGMRLVVKYADVWNTLGGQPTWGNDRVPIDDAIMDTRRQVEALEATCTRAGRDPSSLRRSMLAYKAGALTSVDAFEEFVGRYREVGIDEFIFPVPLRGDPEIASAREAVLERVATEVIPRMRSQAAARA